jgi:VWFA-related protein
VTPILFSLPIVLAAAAAQVPGPSPSPAQPAIPRIAAETELVELDVVVTDRDGRAVTDLGPDSFELLEDGQPRPISHFVPGFTPAPGAAAPPPAGQAPAVPSPPPAEVVPKARFIVLAVDDYHLEPADLPYVTRAVRRFIDEELGTGDQVMVVATSGSLGALQQFTADREVLRHAVDRIRPQSRSYRPSPLDVPRITEYQAELIEAGDREALSMGVEEIMASAPATQQSASWQERYEQRVRLMARQIVASTAHVTSLTLSALERLVDGLRPVRGRKVVVFFSGGFFLGSARETGRHEMLLVADAAARSGVVFYTIDSRGLTSTAPIGNAALSGGANIRGARSATSEVTPGTRSRIELRGVDAARDGLNALALDTGGLAFFDRNQLEAPLERVLEDSAVYYRLGFEPRESPRDGRFHKVQVRVPGRSGLRVRAASGYFARGNEPVAATAAVPASGTGEASRLLATALDSPYPLRGLPVDLAAEFMGTDAGDVVAATAWVDASVLPFQPAAGGREAAAFDIVGVVVDEQGKPVDQFSDRVELNLTPESKERAIRNGLTYRKTLAVPPGLLQARVAVRADSNGLLGSASQWVEVPDRKRPELAMSSILLLGEGSMPAAAPPGGRGTVSFDRPEGPEVSRRFPRDGHLDYVLVVYGSVARKETAPADVVVESALLSGSTVLTRSAAAPVGAEGPGGLPMVSGRLRLDPLAAGDYELRLTITDRAAGATGTRSLRFTVG